MEQHVRLADIARETGVSLVTVAKVAHNTGGKNTRVSEKTAEKIRACMKRMNYHPNMLARQLAGKSSDIIGVVLDTCAPMIYQDRLARMERYASELGYRIMIGQAHDDPQRMKSFAEDFISYRVAGVICMAHCYPDVGGEIARSYETNKTVFLEKPDGVENPCYVTIDVEAAFREIVGYYAVHGRKRVALMTLTGEPTSSNMLPRENGYERGIVENGLSFRLIQRVPYQIMMDADALEPILSEMVEKYRIDALAASNDHMAAAMIKAFGRMGVRVPCDVAVSGYDNVDICTLITPSLTTFYDRRGDVAKALMDLFVKLTGPRRLAPEERTVTFKPEFIERDST